jgi:hypothetical protein
MILELSDSDIENVLYALWYVAMDEVNDKYLDLYEDIYSQITNNNEGFLWKWEIELNLSS